MRRRRDVGSHFARMLDDGYGKRRALRGVGAGAELVKQQKRIVAALIQYMHYVRHVCREGRQVLLDRLLVSDIGEHMSVYGHSAAVVGRYMQTALRHDVEKANGLERDGLAAGIGSGYDESVKILAELEAYGHGLVTREQWVPRAAQHDALFPELRLHAAELIRQLCACENTIERY